MNEQQIERLIEGFEGLKSVVLSLDRRLLTLEEKVEVRLYDTRPMLDAVLAKLDRLEERLDRMEERLSRMEERLDKLEARLDRLESAFEQFREETREQLAQINHQLEILTLDVMDVRAKQRSLDKRLTTLENPSLS
jgi:chromosome segregation ATPase